jgi:hypothetical protein
MRRTLELAALLAATLAALSPSASATAPDSTGVITVLEGSAYVYRAAVRLQAVEGIRVAPGDIFEVGEGGFLRVELSDRTDLQLGPQTSAMLDQGGSHAKPDHWLYLMRGWAKLASDHRDKGAPGIEVRSVLVTVPPNQGVTVTQLTPEEAFVFAQSGEARAMDAHAPVASPGMVLKQGDLFHRKAGGWKGAIDHAAMAGFLGGVPRAFRDTLPPLADRYKGREDKQAPQAPDFGYADVERWLNAEAPVRRQFVQRWRGKAENSAFRASLIANLSAHPEWDPILFPEKYKPKADSEKLDQLLQRSAYPAGAAPGTSK